MHHKHEQQLSKQRQCCFDLSASAWFLHWLILICEHPATMQRGMPQAPYLPTQSNLNQHTQLPL